MKINDPVRNFDSIQQAVRDGFLVRTRADAGTEEARHGDTTRRDKALASGAQFISTDYPEPDKRFGDYRVRLPGELVARANPVSLPEADATLELESETTVELGMGRHGYAQSGDVRLHYVTAGDGPLLILLHGFPDYWYTWRQQIPTLAQRYQVVALDQRGYNRSDQPQGVAHYGMDRLVEDVLAVIAHFQRERAIVVGHDWGGAVAWSCAMQRPQAIERLVVLNLPHPHGLRRELANNPRQRANSSYARAFLQADAAESLSADGLAEWVTDAHARPYYLAAFQRSSFAGMLNYYQANYPREPYDDGSQLQLPHVKCPVLLIHGLEDQALLADGLNNTWDWIDNELTIVTLPRAGHFVQHDAAADVTRIIDDWLP